MGVLRVFALLVVGIVLFVPVTLVDVLLHGPLGRLRRLWQTGASAVTEASHTALDTDPDQSHELAHL